MKRLYASLVACALVGLTGCLSYKYYDGPELNRLDTGEIYLVSQRDEPLIVTAINERRIRYRFRNQKRAYVLPGQYVVKLRTVRGELIRGEGKPREHYAGVVTFTFEVKPGYSYFFKLAGKWASAALSLPACVYEELQNDPKARISSLGEFREPGENARELNCSPVISQLQ